MVLLATLVLGAILLLLATRLRGLASLIPAAAGLGAVVLGLARELAHGRPWGPAAVAAGVGFSVAIRYQLRTRRRQALARFGRMHGLRFSKSVDAGPDEGTGRLQLTNMLEGAWHGLPVRVADCVFADAAGPWRWYPLNGRHRMSVAMITISRAVQTISVRPHIGGAQLAPRLLVRGSASDGDAFGRRFRVESADEDATARLLDPPMVEWLLSLPDDWGIEVVGSRAMVCGPLVHPGDVALVLDMVDGLARRLAHETSATEPDAMDRSEPG